jgi:hypothetical protein
MPYTVLHADKGVRASDGKKAHLDLINEQTNIAYLLVENLVERPDIAYLDASTLSIGKREAVQLPVMSLPNDWLGAALFTSSIAVTPTNALNIEQALDSEVRGAVRIPLVLKPAPLSDHDSYKATSLGLKP